MKRAALVTGSSYFYRKGGRQAYNPAYRAIVRSTEPTRMGSSARSGVRVTLYDYAEKRLWGASDGWRPVADVPYTTDLGPHPEGAHWVKTTTVDPRWLLGDWATLWAEELAARQAEARAERERTEARAERDNTAVMATERLGRELAERLGGIETSDARTSRSRSISITPAMLRELVAGWSWAVGEHSSQLTGELVSALPWRAS